MSTRLVILGLLKKRPLHGYELKHIIESHMGDWTNIAFGSIYFALKKLKEEKLVREIGREKQGSRPSRRIYEVTEEGGREFLHLLEKLWTARDREYYALDIGLFFIHEFSKEKRIALIQSRIKGLESGLKHLISHEEETMSNPDVPKEAAVVFSHSRYHMEAELKWLREVSEMLV